MFFFYGNMEYLRSSVSVHYNSRHGEKFDMHISGIVGTCISRIFWLRHAFKYLSPLFPSQASRRHLADDLERRFLRRI